MRKMIYLLAQGLRALGIDFHEENDVRVQNMRETIKKLGSLEFTLEIAPNGSWVAESKNIDGILTGGTSRERMDAVLKDAIFTYFGIPPHLCDDTLIKAAGEESVVLEHRVYA